MVAGDCVVRVLEEQQRFFILDRMLWGGMVCATGVAATSLLQELNWKIFNTER